MRQRKKILYKLSSLNSGLAGILGIRNSVPVACLTTGFNKDKVNHRIGASPKMSAPLRIKRPSYWPEFKISSPAPSNKAPLRLPLFYGRLILCKNTETTKDIEFWSCSITSKWSKTHANWPSQRMVVKICWRSGSPANLVQHAWHA